jgi:hypothetical protein
MSVLLSSLDRVTAASPPADVGDRVRIERDETRYPSKGTWPRFRGRIGTVVEINVDRKRAHLTEYGVVFGAVRHLPDGSIRPANGRDVATFFKRHEMRVLAPQRHANGSSGRRRVVVPAEFDAHRDPVAVRRAS